MERIKNALEKARSIQGLPPEFDSEKKIRRDNISRRNQPGNKSPLKDLTYDKTRVVSLDPLLLEKQRIVANNKHNLHSNIFDMLRAQVLSRMKENNWKTIAVVSPSPSSGKSVISINLAMSIAQFEERSAMLIDFDLRRPTIASYLGLEKSKCVVDILEGKSSVEDVLINPSQPRLVVLPTHRTVSNSAELLGSTEAKLLITDVRDRYHERIVIIDLPPILSVDDALTVIPQVDCVLLVVASGLSTQKDIEETRHYLGNTNIVGTVFNKAYTKENSGYGY